LELAFSARFLKQPDEASPVAIAPKKPRRLLIDGIVFFDAARASGGC